MNRDAKKLLKENNKLEEKLSEKSQNVLTDIVVYLRDSKISEYNQEEIRRDIIEMVLEGESRNETAKDVIGEDYKAFCDEIISAFPPIKYKERIFNLIGDMCLYLIILSVIWIVKSFVIDLIVTKKVNLMINLSLSDLINGVLIICISIGFVKYICKTSFADYDEVKENKIKTFIIAWVILFVIFGGIFLIDYFVNIQILSIPIILVVIIDVILFIIKYVLEGRNS